MYYLTAGESHGEKIVVIVEDVCSGISINESDIDFELKRRSKGPGRSMRQDEEQNCCKIVSGVIDGKTIGSPVCVEVQNSASADIADESIVRPGHADLNGVIKHNFDDCKNVSERASARETVGRVVAGTIAKNMLANFDVEVYGYVTSIGNATMKTDPTNKFENIPTQSEIEISEVMCPDQKVTKKMLSLIQKADVSGDTLGGSFNIVVVGAVAGLGGYSQGRDRLDSKLAAAVCSVPSVKSVAFGSAGFQSQNLGSACVDGIIKDEISGALTRENNFCGGIEGGMTNGMHLVLSCAVKPPSTLKLDVKTIDLKSMELTYGQSNRRSDVCVVPNAAVVCESEVALVIATEYQNKFGHDNLGEIVFALDSYRQRIKQLS